MAANGYAQKGQPYPEGHWGKWRGVICSFDDCDKPAKCKGLCNSHYNKQRWADGVRSPSVNAEARRAAHLRHRYGIDAADYARMFAEQGGLCAICKQPPTKKNTRAHWDGKLCVDHCHDTGRVRALLCNDCNLVVGYGKTEEILLSAAAYIRDRG